MRVRGLLNLQFAKVLHGVTFVLQTIQAEACARTQFGIQMMGAQAALSQMLEHHHSFSALAQLQMVA